MFDFEVLYDQRVHFRYVVHQLLVRSCLQCRSIEDGLFCAVTSLYANEYKRRNDCNEADTFQQVFQMFSSHMCTSSNLL